MSFDIIIYFLFYFAAIFSVIGYGLLFGEITNIKIVSKNFGYVGLFGLFLLTIYSYISNFFYSHSFFHNSILLIIGFFFFLYSLLIRKNLVKKQVFQLISIFLILFISILIFKTHDDFPYYHFAYSYYLTQSSSHIGIGPFNHGFRTPSSIFYMNSLFYLPVIKHYLFHLPALMIMGFANLIFIDKIFDNLKKNNINFVTFFSLLSILFVNIFFYRVGEHGTDRSSQILVFILLIEILLLFNFRYILEDKLFKIFILIGLIISLKAFYVLYILFFIPILIFLTKEDNLIILKIFKNKFFHFLVIFVSLILLTNFFNTGCLLYPVSITCFPSFIWSFDLEIVNQMNNWYEQWSKAGAGPNFRVDNPQMYIKFFNWVPNWIEIYFFNKVSDFILGTLFLSIVIYLIFNSKTFRKIEGRKSSMVFIVLLILLIEWFYNHPSLRYGGYVVISSLIFLAISLRLEKKINLRSNLKNKFQFLILLGFLIFFGRNIDRLLNENEVYSYNPLTQPYYSFDSKFYSIQNRFDKLLKNYEICNNGPKNQCLSDLEPRVIKSFGKYIFINDR